MIVLVAALIYVLLLLMLAEVFRMRDGGVGTVLVFGIAAGVYYVAIPVEAVLSGRDYFVRFGRVASLEPASLELIVGLACGALLSFSAGLWLSGYRASLDPGVRFASDSEVNSGKHARGMIYIAALMLIILAASFRSELVMVSTYVGNYTTVYSNPLFAFTIRLAAISIAVLSVYYLWRGKRLAGVLGCATLVAWGMYSSDKDYLLIGVIVAGAFVLQSNVVRKKWIAPVLVVVLTLLAGIGPTLFSLYRAGADVSVARALEGGVYMKSDPAGPFYSLILTVEGGQDLEYGRTYATSAFNWIPRFVWRERPLTLSEEFAMNEIPNWVGGQGMGYSLLAESYRNFGILGPIIQYLLLGFAWGWAWKTVRKIWSGDQILYGAFHLVVGCYILTVMHRGDSALVFTQLARLMGVVVLAVWLLGRWRFGK